MVHHSKVQTTMRTKLITIVVINTLISSRNRLHHYSSAAIHYIFANSLHPNKPAPFYRAMVNLHNYKSLVYRVNLHCSFAWSLDYMHLGGEYSIT